MKRTVQSLSCLFVLASLGACGAAPDEIDATDEPGEDEEEVDEAQSAVVLSTRLFALTTSASTSFSTLTSNTTTFNSKGGAVTVERVGLGNYLIRFGNAQSNWGSPQVVAFGGTPTRCMHSGIQLETTGSVARVRCFNAAGAAADSRFIYSYEDTPTTTAIGTAYTACVNPSATHAGPQAITYNQGWINGATITRFGTGSYDVTFPGLNSGGGNIQLSAMGSETSAMRACQVTTSGKTASGNTFIGVSCFGANGVLADSMFTVKYTSKTAPLPGKTGWVWATNTTPNTAFTPTSFGSWNEPLASATANTGSNGVSQFIGFPSFPAIDGTHRSNVFVTAAGTSTTAVHCKPAAWSALQVSVACFNGAGTPILGRHLTYLLNQDT